MTSPSRTQHLGAARAERRALDAWAKSGRVGQRPPTPTLDAIKHEHEAHAPPRGDDEHGRRGD